MDKQPKDKGFIRRIVALAVLVVLVLVLFLLRLAQFQLFEGASHAETAASARPRGAATARPFTETIPAYCGIFGQLGSFSSQLGIIL